MDARTRGRSAPGACARGAGDERRRDRTTPGWRRAVVAIASVGLVLGLIARLLLLVAGPGHRLGWWSFATVALMRYAAYGGIAAAAVSALALILAPLRGQRRGMFRALAA